MPTSVNQFTIKQLLVFISPFIILAILYTISVRQTTYNSSVADNSIGFDGSFYSGHITTSTSTQRYYHNNKSTLAMTDLDHDYTADDYRAFLFAQHPIHGMLLLYCSRKKKKPPHFQAPGGHVDNEDFESALSRLKKINAYNNCSHPLLVLACKIGAARELYEETGIDIRNDLDRLHPVKIREKDNGVFTKSHVLKHRLFFKICFGDEDFVTEGFDSKDKLGWSRSMNDTPPMLMIKLSHEHQGFTFEPDPKRAVDLLINHSGGKVSTALELAIAQGEIIDVAPNELEETYKTVGSPMSKEEEDHSEIEKGVFECLGCC